MHELAKLTSTEIEKLVNQGITTAILPVGAVEQHGKHLAVCYDIAVAERLAFDLAKKLEAFLLPAVSYGASSHHLGFSGTLSLSENTFQSILFDLVDSLVSSGIKTVMIVNGHGGNYPSIQKVAERCKSKPIRFLHDGDSQFIFQTIKELSQDFNAGALGLHGGRFETSLALYTHESYVRPERDLGLMPAGSNWLPSEIKEIISRGLKAVAPNGVIGDPTESSKNEGADFYQRLYQKYLGLY